MAGSSWPSILTSNNLRLWRLPFIEYSKDMDGIYKNIEEYNPSKKWKVLIVFDYMIAEVLSNKKLNPIVTELFIRGRKSNISYFYYTFLFCYSKRYETKFKTLFCHQIPNKRELQQTAFNHSCNTDFQDFMNLY